MNHRLNDEDLPTADDISAEISNIKATVKDIKDSQPHRAAWHEFPDVLILKDESTVKHDPLYPASKAGDAYAAATMLKDMLTLADIAQIQRFIKT